MKISLPQLPSAGRVGLASLAVLVLSELHVQGQTTAPASEGAAQPTNKDVVTLSPFQVSGESVQGYATTSAASASRIALPITELPTSVIVINEKIIEDTVAVTAADTLNLIGGVSAISGTTSNDTARRGHTARRGQVLSFSVCGL